MMTITKEQERAQSLLRDPIFKNILDEPEMLMLNKVKVLELISIATKELKSILNKDKVYRGHPVVADMYDWGSVKLEKCYVCLAGGVFLEAFSGPFSANNNYLIDELPGMNFLNSIRYKFELKKLARVFKVDLEYYIGSSHPADVLLFLEKFIKDNTK